MRIALVVHGLPPFERTGVETHVAHLAAGLARAGCDVAVLAARRSAELPHLARRSEWRGPVEVVWLNLAEPPRDVAEECAPPGVAEAVGEWLDLWAPDLVHVHHLRGLGWGVLEAVGARGLPLVYTAHDDHAVCHRVAHLRPDLSRCDALGDAAACARCDRAVELLHARPELGDWHLGVEPERLDAELRAQLERRLAGDDAGLARAVEARARADARRAAALAGVDRVFAPTRRLAELLVAAGLERERVVLQPYGIPPLDVAPLTPNAHGPLRVAFLGGMSKHKGPQVVVEACAGLEGVELALHGDSTDRVFVERLRARAAAVGARWCGAYAAAELPSRLGQADLVCVPSLWVENAPLVIREAFAAGRPVLASDLGALPESVRDGIDGLLLPAGDVGAWRAAIAGLAADRARLARLAAGVRTPRALDDSVAELLGHYAELTRPRAAVPAHLPAHLVPFQERRAALAALPFESLCARTRAGIARLRAGLDLSPAVVREPDAALERARELVRDRRGEARWRAAAARDGVEARAHLAAEAAWLRELCAERDAELGRLRTAGEAAAAEARWLRGVVESLEARQRDHEALAAHERWLRGEAVRLLAALEAAPGAPSEEHAGLAAALDEATARARELVEELAWRRGEMRRALDEGGGVLGALLAPSSLGRRLGAWREGGGA